MNWTSTHSMSGLLIGRMIALAVVFFFGIFIAAYFHFGSEESEYENAVLKSIATYLSGEYVATALVPDGAPAPFQLVKPDRFDDLRPLTRYVILGPSGEIVAGSPEGPNSSEGPKPFAPEFTQVNELTNFSDDNPQTGELMAGVALPFFFRGERHVLQAEIKHSDLTGDETLADELFEFSWGLLILPVFIPVVVWTVRRSLQPLTEVGQQAASIGPLTMNRRLSRENVPDEIVPLVDAFNLALNRIEEGVIREREFAANAAHELRTPLAILHSRAETLTTLDEIPEFLKDLTNVERIVTQLLRLAQADNLVVAGNQTADLGKAAAAAISMIVPMAIKQGKEIELKKPAETLTVQGDEEYLCMAIRNLVENAVSSSPPGSAVTVELEAPATVRVIDIGLGMSEDLKSRIFRRFERGNRARSNGAGLGLSIVERIVEAHKGNLRVVSEPGKGAIFTMTLKATQSQNI
ncbi:MAG: ATP-binding protein [Parvibaculum sp.]